MPCLIFTILKVKEIFSCDQVFVLSRSLRNSVISKLLILVKETPSEKTKIMYSIGKAIEGDVEMVMESQKMVMEKLTHMSEDLEKKVSDIVKDLNDMISKANI